MAILEIEGRQVEVDDSFLQLSPEDQQATVEEISASFQPVSNPFEQPQETSGYGSQILSGLLEGATGALGAPVDLVNNLVVAPAAAGINSLFGTNIQPSQTPLGGSAGLRQGLAISEPSQDGGEQFARRVAQSVGGAAVPIAGSAGSVGQAAAGLGTALGGGVAGALSQQIAPDNIGLEIAAELLGGAGTGAAISGMANRSARAAAEKAVPSIDELKQQAGDLYRQAEARGVVADAGMTQSLADDITKIARDSELITPTGRISEAYPKAKEAMQLMRDYAGYDMNPTQMQVIRDTLADAAFTTEGKEARIASKMLRSFDQFAEKLAPELSEARKVSQRYLQAGQLETLREVAGANAGQFSGSGFENSLRNQYRGLDRNLAKGRQKGFSPELTEAVQDVSRGTAGSNAARFLGKFSPTGVVSATGTAGLGAMAGQMAGSPFLGGAIGLGGMGAGLIGRKIATDMGIRNADIAELLARNGGALQNTTNPQVRDAVIQALIGSQLAAQSGGR